MKRTMMGLVLLLTSLGLATASTRRRTAARMPDGAPVQARRLVAESSDGGALRVAFQPRALIGQYAEGDGVNLYQVGVVEDGGEYVGGSLLLLRVTGERGPCKGPGCGGPYYARLIRAQDRLVYLPQLSSDRTWLATLLTGGDMGDIFAEDSAANRTLLAFLQRQGKLATDSEAVVPALAYRRAFTFRGLEFRLAAYGGDTDGTPDSTLLRPAFTHDTLGTIYTTRTDAAPQGFFYYRDRAYEVSGGDGQGVAACRDEECYRSNAFFWFRPDGTYLRYVYQPPFTVNDVRLMLPGRLAREYLSWTRWGCSDGQADYASVVSPAALGNGALQKIGSIAGTDDSILGLVPTDEEYARAFYERYVSERHEWAHGEQSPPVTFADFTRDLPFFFWKDPFGRLIRFANAAYLPPLTCEPVIYLYPRRARRVEVRLGDGVRVLRSLPAYRDSWNVRASPSGSLRAAGEERPFLFWEGIAGLLPRPERGFVVARRDVDAFFRRTLSRLGLRQSEIGDFLKAWLPAFTEAPFYRIGFYDRATIDTYAPLRVTPAPATMIRVLFDYQPLRAPVTLAEPTLPPAPRREGFTVVEWGGLKR